MRRSLHSSFALSRPDLLNFFANLPVFCADLLPGLIQLLLARLLLLPKSFELFVFGQHLCRRLLLFSAEGLTLKCVGCDLRLLYLGLIWLQTLLGRALQHHTLLFGETESLVLGLGGRYR